MMGRYYPAYLDIQDRRCVVIGAGTIATRKVRQLVNSGAAVSLISPSATKSLRDRIDRGELEWIQRSYRKGDLSGAFLAIAATNDGIVNRLIHEEATIEKVLLNVVDVPDLCTFIAPAIVEHGSVSIAISTSGTSPALARRLRELMDGSRPIDCTDPGKTTCRCLVWADAAEILAEVRLTLKAEARSATPKAWQEAMDDELLALVERGQAQKAKERLLRSLLQPTGTKC